MIRKAKAKKVKVENFNLTRARAKKILKIIDAGLSHGLGDPIPGQMCVEAAVSYGMGYSHSDKPKCVTDAISDTKIAINDWDGWDQVDSDVDSEKTKKVRSKALRRLAIAQLGSADIITDDMWLNAVAIYLMKKDGTFTKFQEETSKLKIELLEAIEDLENGKDIRVEIYRSSLSEEFETESILENLTDIKSVKKLCEDLVKILIQLKSPGTKFLDLTRV